MYRSIVLCLAWFLSAFGYAHAQTTQPWTQLSLATCKVDELLKAHPDHDGRGVVVAVLDTGVDPTIPGITTTSTGEVKVVDLQDFSGQGDVELRRVNMDEATGKLIRYDDKGVPLEYTPPGVPGDDLTYRFGLLREANFVNSDLPDINDNGRTDDEFPICVVTQPGDGDDDAVCFVDTNLDRSFADEKPLRNYRLKFDTFTLHRAKPERQIVPVAFAVNMFLRQKKVVVHYDDGGHGTHVAGIATGCNINNQPGFNGVAPGAKIIGLKIGQNAEGGITVTCSMKKAFEYAARYARENRVPVVCNLSYGVGSTMDGKSDIDEFADELLRKNPYMMFCSSGGNAGPGLSSIGTPAAGASIIAAAALLAHDSARDVFGWTYDGPRVAVFSARGGELLKPNIAAPGYATSSVPRFKCKSDFWRGTSMASPYAAGLCAVLISHAQAKHPGKPVRACDVKRALCLSAQPVHNATFHDVGYGVPDLPKAAKVLNGLMTAAKDDPVIDYEISTRCPHGPEGKAPAAYWRGVYFPTEAPQTFKIKPIFFPGTDKSARTSFVRRFDLVNACDWCSTDQKHVYLRSEQAANVHVKHDPDKLKQPGVYVGHVKAMHDGMEAFRLMSTIIVPRRATPENGYTIRLADRTADGWTPDRWFLAVPPGASSMVLRLAAPPDARSTANMTRIFDPDGLRLRNRAMRLNTDKGKREVKWTVDEELSPGVWEVCVVNDRPDRTSPYDFVARFFGLHAEPAAITSWSKQKPGSPPSGDLTVTNIFDAYAPVSASGRVEGFRKEHDDEFTGLNDTIEHSIKLDPAYRGVRIAMKMTKEDYAQTTDIGVMVLDADGEALYQDGFTNHRHEFTVDNPTPEAEPTTLTLKIHGGFAVDDDERETPINVKIDHLLADAVNITVERGDAAVTAFVPGVPVKLSFACDGPLPATPSGMRPVGYLQFCERASNETMCKVPVDIAD